MNRQEQLAHWSERTDAERLASSHYSRAKRLHGGKPNGFWTAGQWLRLCTRAGWWCAYCREPTKQLSPDHIWPLAHGGSNRIENIAPVCRECQLKKGAKPVWEWFDLDQYEALLAWLHPGHTLSKRAA